MLWRGMLFAPNRIKIQRSQPSHSSTSPVFYCIDNCPRVIGSHVPTLVGFADPGYAVARQALDLVRLLGTTESPGDNLSHKCRTTVIMLSQNYGIIDCDTQAETTHQNDGHQ